MMKLENYINIDRVVRKEKPDGLKPDQSEKDMPDKRFNHLWFVKRQKYFNEKIYYDKTIPEVLSELEQNNVVSITRIMPYDNCAIIQYEKVI